MGIWGTPFKKGHIPWNKGKTWSDETRERMSQAHKCKHHSPETEFKKGHKPSITGKKRGPMSKEHKEKISKAMKNRMPKNFKTLHLSENIRKSLKRRIPSSLEEKFQGIVNKYNLPYKFVGDGSFIIGGKNPDFINTNNEKIAIEVYARYYKQRDDRQIERWKKERNKVFEEYGWKIVYFDETEMREENIIKILG